MNVVIHGAGFENKGAEAMLRTVQFEWSRRCPDTTFFLAARPPDVHEALLQGITPLIPANTSPEAAHRLTRRFRAALKARLGASPSLRQSRLEGIRNTVRTWQIEQFDAFIDISGYQYGDAWGDRGYNSVMPWVCYCKENGIPAIFLPQSWGPFTRQQGAEDMRQILASKPLVMSRDARSTQHLKELDPEVEHKEYPDIAWLFEGAPASVGNRILADLGIDVSRPLIALVPNMRVYEKAGRQGAANVYLKAFADVARHALDTTDASILLLPNEIRMPSSQHPDDRYLCSILETMIGNRQRCFVMRQPASAEALKSMLSQCETVMASRFHSLIFSLSSGVPSLAVGWSHKYEELMGDINLREFSIHFNAATPPDLTAPFDALWTRRAAIRADLPARTERLKKRAAEAFDQATEFARSHKSQ